jgi:hypothetical protein
MPHQVARTSGPQDEPQADPYLDITRLTADTGFTRAFDIAVTDYVARRTANPR